MKTNLLFKKFSFIMILILATSLVSVAQKKKILFLGVTGTYEFSDTAIYNRLAKTYDLTKLVVSATTVSEISQSTNANYAKNYDAIFVTEAITTGQLDGLLTLDVPVINTKSIACRQKYWGIYILDADRVEVKTFAEAPVTIYPINSNHQLAAGLSGDINLVKDGSPATTLINTMVIPASLNIVKIATLKGDETRNVVFGIEPGATLSSTSVAFPFTTTTKRIAHIGLHVTSINYITNESFKLIDAAANWVMGTITGISQATANKLSIAPMGNKIFNVSFNMAQLADIAVYSTIGKLVLRTKANSNNIVLDLSNQNSGVYIVKIKGSKVNGTQKIVVE